MKVLIAHAEGETEQAEKLDAPLREAGYEPVHYGTILVGESLTEEASKVLNSNGAVVLCGTIKATGTRFARRLVNAARSGGGAVRVFPVRIEEEADLEALTWDGKPAEYWQNPTKAAEQLIESLKQYYPLNADARQIIRQHGLEARYRELALKSCDIIDLANLPEDDWHLASRELELRRLYVALRMRLEVQVGDDADDKTLEALEQRRSRGWGQAQRQYSGEEGRVALGERLGQVQRLVILGDPGAGKSTLLRWLATAYLLRLQQDPDWRDLPDVASLPERDWLPILIRCRDLPPEAADCLETMLQHSLRKNEFPAQECTDLCALLRDKLEQGEALLLVDGLDEITEPGARARFAQQIEQISRAYEQAPLIVTSRIVGYREMGYRLRAGFEHLTVADLSREDKDDFARRWCALTERPERQEAAAEELIRDMHSNDRIERLTGNPMLLTTMALIKRKLNRLPQRRVDLYEKAVEVLLNWRSAVDEPLDPREALPQLEYLAHAMCSQGIQQIREDQVLDLLRQVREEYPNIHPLRQHSPEDFLGLLERRTGLLIQSGHTRHKGRSLPVYEFRHLTFQEYLAGIALVAGHYQGQDKSKSLAEVIAPLAGKVEDSGRDWFLKKEDKAVVENWREALHLCMAACNDDDVDAALLAILHPLPGETDTVRARVVQAASCLTDEPNMNEEVAHKILRNLSKQMREDDAVGRYTILSDTVAKLADSRWATLLSECLLDEFFLREGKERYDLGWPFAMVQRIQLQLEESELFSWVTEQALHVSSNNERESVAFSLIIMDLSWDGTRLNCQLLSFLADCLICCLLGRPALSLATAWALGAMNAVGNNRPTWHPNSQQIKQLLTVAKNSNCEMETLHWLCDIFSNEKTTQAIDILIPLLSSLSINTSRTRMIMQTLGAIGGKQAVDALKTFTQDADFETRCAALGGLVQVCDEGKIDWKLLTHDLSGYDLDEDDQDQYLQWSDPQAPITTDRIAKAAERLERPAEEIACRYAMLAQRFGLTLEPEVLAMADQPN